MSSVQVDELAAEVAERIRREVLPADSLVSVARIADAIKPLLQEQQAAQVAELERVKGERDAAVADHESAMKAMQSIGHERDDARAANDELGKQNATLTAKLERVKTLEQQVIGILGKHHLPNVLAIGAKIDHLITRVEELEAYKAKEGTHDRYALIVKLACEALGMTTECAPIDVEEAIEALKTQQLNLARAYDPNCDEYHYESQLAAMKAARETVEALQELAMFLGGDPEEHLASVPDKAMGRMEAQDSQLELVQEELAKQKRELNAAVQHHSRYVDKIDLALGEPRQDDCDILTAHLNAIAALVEERDAIKAAHDNRVDLLDRLEDEAVKVLPYPEGYRPNAWEALADLPGEYAKLKQERDAALRQCTEFAKQVGLAQGELAASEMAGMVRDWKERADRTLRWLRWFVGEDLATVLRRAAGRGCAEWQLEEIRKLWEGGEAVSDNEWRERAERAEGELAKLQEKANLLWQTLDEANDMLGDCTAQRCDFDHLRYETMRRCEEVLKTSPHPSRDGGRVGNEDRPPRSGVNQPHIARANDRKKRGAAVQP